MKCQHGVDVFGRCAPCEEGAYLILISELKAELAAAWAEIERMTGELASANRECEVRNERELGYLARAQSAEAELEALRAVLALVREHDGRDAARWRHWRLHAHEFGVMLPFAGPADMDSAIDAAIARGKE